MAKIIGNTTVTPYPRPDWNQTDENRADYIKNKPDISALQDQITEVASIAKGRATGHVFDTYEAMTEWLSKPENINGLTLGDNLYIRATDVPDYWWDGTKPQQLETQKVDLTEYVEKEDEKGLSTAEDVNISLDEESGIYELLLKRYGEDNPHFLTTISADKIQEKFDEKMPLMGIDTLPDENSDNPIASKYIWEMEERNNESFHMLSDNLDKKVNYDEYEDNNEYIQGILNTLDEQVQAKVDKEDGLGLSNVVNITMETSNEEQLGTVDVLHFTYTDGSTDSVGYYSAARQKAMFDERQTQITALINTKQDKSNIRILNTFDPDNDWLCLEQNDEIYITSPITYLQIGDITIDFAENIGSKAYLYFTSGDSIEFDDMSSCFTCIGDDCNDGGTFIPLPNTSYEITFHNVGNKIIARVGAC